MPLSSIDAHIPKRSDLLEALESNLRWIIKSFTVNKDGGSAAYQTIWGTWAASYPETTGYLLPTLQKANGLLPSLNLTDYINSAQQYLTHLKLSTGAYAQSNGIHKPLVFDTAQILLGRLQLKEPHTTPLEQLATTYHWLVSQINPEGIFTSHLWKHNYNPAYHSRVAWALLLYEMLCDIKHNPKTLQLLKNLFDQRSHNGFYNTASFTPGGINYTHLIMYTYRGLYESALIIDNQKVLKAIEDDVMKLCQLILHDKSFGGAYNKDWYADFSFVCCTGNAQLCVLLTRIFQQTDNAYYLEAISYLIKPLMHAQKKLIHQGRIPSSLPIWGKYQRFKYTNWTQKFYCDALIALIDLNQSAQ